MGSASTHAQQLADMFVAKLPGAQPPVSPASADVPELDYALDSVPRSVTASDALTCDERRLVPYAGEVIPYTRAARVDAAFRPHLMAFERVVQEVAREHYGRAPEKIRHVGVYACRRIRGLSMWVSEHALGNAIDVAGFEFGPAVGPLPARLAKTLEEPFKVTVLQHWNATSGLDAVHRRFLRDLVKRLIARGDIFRSLLGPKASGHRNHFHFDMGTVRLVEM